MIQAAKQIFISYDPNDENLLCKLEKQLSGLIRKNLITIGHRRKVPAGIDKRQEIAAQLNSAQIILLLISDDFIASGYFDSEEMKQARKLQDSGKARVIPVILRPVYWEPLPFSNLTVLPSDGQAVTQWSDLDSAFLDIVKGIIRIIKDLDRDTLVDLSPARQVRNITEVVSFDKLRHALMILNYWEQIPVFRQFKNEKHQKIGAFFIYGAPSYGHGLLLERLIRMIPASTTIEPFRSSFESKTEDWSVQALWGKLAKWVNPKEKSLPRPRDTEWQIKVVNDFYEKWQRETVILILDRLHDLEEGKYLDKFLQEFWLRLTEKVRNTPSQNSERYLLLFLIDTKACIDTWKIDTAREPDHLWEPRVPIKLEKLSLFTHEVLEDWIRHEDILGELTAEDILNKSEGGIPELVLDYICDRFGYEWTDFVRL